jgi:N-acetylmuramoyl-L-alanine amidase
MTVQQLTRLSILALSTCLPLAAGAAPSIKDVRLSNQSDGTRVVVELTESTRQKVFTLDNPARVVIDLPATSWSGKLPLGEGVVKSLRAAKRDNGDLRIVLDLTAAVRPYSSWLAADNVSGPRLVLDLASSVSTNKNVTTPVATLATTPVTTNDTRAATVEVPAPVLVAPTPTPAAEPAPAPIKSVSNITTGRDLIIAIDAGHGGEDPGAIGGRGVKEKNVTLAIAKLLKERIDAEPGMRAVLTRDGDYFVPLRERINRARQHQADMFVSIHADSVNDNHVSGASVYTLSPKGATNEAARWLADRENAADMVGGVSLDNKSGVLASVLLDLSQGATMGASMEAASRVLKQLDGLGSTHHSSVQQAGFVVLKSPDIPSMLVETAFISNPVEEARLSDPRHQARLADAVLTGVRDYFYTNSPPGSRVAQLKAMRQARAD